MASSLVGKNATLYELDRRIKGLWRGLARFSYMPISGRHFIEHQALAHHIDEFVRLEF
jgi:hypothetical protein